MGQLMLALTESNAGFNICLKEVKSHRGHLNDELGYTKENELGGNKG